VAAGTSRIAMGVKFQTLGALSPRIEAFDCPDGDDGFTAGSIDLTDREQPGFRIFDLIETKLRCLLAGGDAGQVLKDNADLLLSEALTTAATTQITADHLNLADDSTSVGSGAIVAAMGLIEDGLADRISNAQGYIFVPITLLASAKSTGVVRLVDGALMSPAGHKVISDAGHGSQSTLYGTAQLAYALSGTEVRGGPGDYVFDPTNNTIAYLSETYGLVVFNPAFSVRATVS